MSEQLAVPEELQFDLADRLRKSLRYADVSSQALAEYLEVSRHTISNWLNGHTRPRPAELKMWAMRCGVPYQWLIHGVMTGEDAPRSGHQRSRYEPDLAPVDPTDPETGQTRAVLALQKRLRERIPVDAALTGQR